jgi:hypothetical protein
LGSKDTLFPKEAYLRTMQSHDDMLMNLYIPQDQEEVLRSYRYVEILIKEKRLPQIDYDEFMENLGYADP